MKIKDNSTSFEPCPEFTGKGVCVDVTPLRRQQSQFGERDVLKIVFEVDADRDDGSRFCVWSKNFTPSLNEKANLRKFLRGWYGRDLTKQELEDFDTETLVGKPAQLVVVHEHKDGETYANIAACTPDKTREPLTPCGKYVRVQDRKPDGKGQAPDGRSQTPTGGGYRRAERMPENGSETPASGVQHAAVKIHVGRCKGLEMRDLSTEQVQALLEHWLPGAKANAKPTADDKRLIAALEWWHAQQAVPAAADDNVPY